MIQMLLALCLLLFVATVQKRWLAALLAILAGYLLRGGAGVTGTGLAKYEAARAALAAAKSVDEVLGVRDAASALAAYARIAQDTTLETDAAEMRFRAERKLGDMMAGQRATIGLAPPGRRPATSPGLAAGSGSGSGSGSNSELRRVMCEVAGWPKAIEMLGAVTIAHDALHGQRRELIDVAIGPGERVRLIRLVNGTVEADGTRHAFVEGVPLDVTTPHEAEAWAYGIAPAHYREAVRT